MKHQVAADLRARIMAGELAPGAQLPSTPQLEALYKTSNPTVQSAVRLLKEEGFLSSHRGKGVYVRDKQPFTVDVSPYIQPSPGGYSYDLLEVAEVVPVGDIAQGLGLSEGERAVLRKRILRLDGEPLELDWSYYPLHIVAGSPLTQRRKVQGGAPRVLAELGFPQREMVDTVSVRMPTTEEVEALDLPDVPVMRQFRVIYSDDQRAVEVSELIKGAHLYQLRYRQEVS
jgi:GntR family transcriptional regulator